MRHHVIKGDCWVHVFPKDTFAGRSRRLSQGQRAVTRKVGSMVVGPCAIAKVIDGDGQQVLTLPPRMVISDFSKLVSKRNASHIRVTKA